MKENAYLIIHGFAGSTDEIEYLAGYLKARGLDVHTVLLAGHGSTKKELSKYSYTSWISSVEAAIMELKQAYSNVSLLGFSMGGLISVHFSTLPEISKIVFINTPIYFWNIKIILNDIINGIHYRKFEKISYYKKSLLGASIKSGVDFLMILSKTKRRFKEVQKQSLIVQCVNDESVHFKSAEYIKKNIGDWASLQYYNGGCHQVFSKAVELRDSVCNDIYHFLSH